MSIYSYQTAASAPRKGTDVYREFPKKRTSFEGVFDQTIRYVEGIQLLDPVMWHRFVVQFRTEADSDDQGWRGEYWGKMMRGACFTYAYTQNEQLYDVLTETVAELVDSQKENGRISSYGQECEFTGWDLWSRKYVLLGMQYYLEICKDPDFANRVIHCMCGQVDYIMDHIGLEDEGKKPITKATNHWRGMNSCSILEPIVRLYSLTKDKKYLDFATYIVECGGSSIVNIFDLAYENKLMPYQYPMTKAYEMTSCFEGLLEYYRITGNERYKTSVINYADSVLETDFTVIGSGGCTHELFDHSTVRQANTTNEKVAQETCVTVTLMKFFHQLNLLTGEARYVDAFERSLYNAYFGAINTDKVLRSIQDCFPMVLPFDSYSPLTAGTRGNLVGGQKKMADQTFYGCCACIGSAGTGLISKVATLQSKSGVVLNLFSAGVTCVETPNGMPLELNMMTDYPRNGKITIKLGLQKEEQFSISIRNPYWSESTSVRIGEDLQPINSGYIVLDRIWKDRDEITMDLDMRTHAIYPIPYGSQILMNTVCWDEHYVLPTYDEEDPLAKFHIALQRGPLMLAQENRLGYSVDDPVSIMVNDGVVDAVFPRQEVAPYTNMVEVKIPCTDGTWFHVTDYASAGKLWNDESKMAVWMLTK